MYSKPVKTSIDSAKLLIEFIDSIPEYNDINHLSNIEFYEKIETLKQQQRTLFNNVEDDYNDMVARKDGTSPKSEISSMKDTITQPPSRRSVRIKASPSPASSPPGRLKPALNKFNPDHDESHEIDSDRLSKSAPASPVKLPKNDDGITIPEPFQMTLRDEENKIIDDLLVETKQKLKKDPHMFRANPVPIESRIPLFEKLMLDQQLQSVALKERRRAELQAQMRPFSFTKRDELIQDLKRQLSKSTPSLVCSMDHDRNKNRRRFKAKPVPKHLFSNYFYKKMYDNGFYRALQKKIRSEEMLKAASLPPSMAKREQNELRYDVCPKLLKSLQKEEARWRNNKRTTSAHNYDNNKNESPLCDNEMRLSNLDLLSGSRSNLAAVLRIQSARKRLEMEMCKKLEELQLKDENRWKEKLMRKKPIWQTINYDNEEDLDMRLQMRRYEDRLRREEHKEYMKNMYGRVNKQPTLFERQSRTYSKGLQEKNLV